MITRPRREQITKLNSILSNQNEAISNMRLFSDEQQNDSLVNRSNIIKINHKYLQKIDKAQDIIKEARQVNADRAQIVKNGLLRKNVMKRQLSQEPKITEAQHIKTVKYKDIHPIIQQTPAKVKTKSQNSTFIDRKIEEDISRIQQIQHPNEELSENLLPKEILEGQISKSIVSVQHTIVKNYFKDKIKIINGHTSPQKIYRIMNPFYVLCGVKIALPLIKKYKNCAYFGNSNKDIDATYEGFLIIHQEEKLYYGQFQSQKKNGKGTEIDFLNDVVYIGNFSKGRKNGQFSVIKPNQNYIGGLLKGQYHGYGQLTTNFSVYKGYFQKGQRHGEGEEKFLQMGLTICGTFINNKFTNNPEKSEQSMLNTVNNKSQTQQVHSKINKSNQKHMNPQSTPYRLPSDKNVVFQASAFSKRNFQQFDCEFGAEEDEQIEQLQVVNTKKVSQFRIKQVKQPQKIYTERKRTISQQKPNILHSILKS